MESRMERRMATLGWSGPWLLHPLPPHSAEFVLVICERHRIEIGGAGKHLGRWPQHQVVVPVAEVIGETRGGFLFQPGQRRLRRPMHRLPEIFVVPAPEALHRGAEQLAGAFGGQAHANLGGGPGQLASGRGPQRDRATGEQQSARERSELGHRGQPDRACRQIPQRPLHWKCAVVVPLFSGSASGNIAVASQQLLTPKQRWPLAARLRIAGGRQQGPFVLTM